MKKNIKKILCVLMILVLAMSFTACGSKKSSSNADSKDDKNTQTDKEEKLEELTVEEIYEKMSEAAKDVKGSSSEASFVFDVEMADEAMEITGDITCEANIEPINAHMNMELKIEYAEQSLDMDMEMYEIQEDDKIKVYTNVMDQWTYEETDMADMEDLGFDMSMLEDFDFSKLEEFLDIAEVKAEKDGNYKIDITITTDKVIEILESLELGDEIKEYKSMLPDASLMVSLVVDGKTFLPEKMSIYLEMDEFEIEEGQSLKINEVSMDMKYNSYEDVEIKVPDSVVKEAEDNANADLDFDDSEW